ncbi:hypothetical protein [Paenibacillus polymyxa]|uniref:hypothetical protein n=1 Tax=Paenibacillus polymyxa TaxID=1406 RepID=UPI000400DEAC|nr:hypothetical protein [Paenibacillus polymyxa]
MLNKVEDSFIEEAKKAAKQAGGYLTADLFDQFRDKKKTVAWDTYSRKNKITFRDFLKIAKIPSKDEYKLNKTKIQIIQNFKLLNITYGYIDKKSYEEQKYTPSWEYISDRFGIEKMACIAEVKLKNKYIDIDTMISDLKISIKELGYIPTRQQYDELKLKPSIKSLKSKNLSWRNAMIQAEYNSTRVGDKICQYDRCYVQFEASEKLFCDTCEKKVKSEINKLIDSMSLKDAQSLLRELINEGNVDHKLLDEIRKR